MSTGGDPILLDSTPKLVVSMDEAAAEAPPRAIASSSAQPPASSSTSAPRPRYFAQGGSEPVVASPGQPWLAPRDLIRLPEWGALLEVLMEDAAASGSGSVWRALPLAEKDRRSLLRHLPVAERQSPDELVRALLRTDKDSPVALFGSTPLGSLQHRVQSGVAHLAVNLFRERALSSMRMLSRHALAQSVDADIRSVVQLASQPGGVAPHQIESGGMGPPPPQLLSLVGADPPPGTTFPNESIQEAYSGPSLAALSLISEESPEEVHTLPIPRPQPTIVQLSTATLGPAPPGDPTPAPELFMSGGMTLFIPSREQLESLSVFSNLQQFFLTRPRRPSSAGELLAFLSLLPSVVEFLARGTPRELLQLLFWNGLQFLGRVHPNGATSPALLAGAGARAWRWAPVTPIPEEHLSALESLFLDEFLPALAKRYLKEVPKTPPPASPHTGAAATAGAGAQTGAPAGALASTSALPAGSSGDAASRKRPVSPAVASSSSSSTAGQPEASKRPHVTHTFPPRTPQDEIQNFQIQERARFGNPFAPYVYNFQGRRCPVPAIAKPGEKISRGPKADQMTADRPPGVTIAVLARDALARLPNQQGTTVEVTNLVLDSQYIIPGTSGDDIFNAVGGGLTRIGKGEVDHLSSNKKNWVLLYKDSQSTQPTPSAVPSQPQSSQSAPPKGKIIVIS